MELLLQFCALRIAVAGEKIISRCQTRSKRRELEIQSEREEEKMEVTACEAPMRTEPREVIEAA